MLHTYTHTHTETEKEREFFEILNLDLVMLQKSLQLIPVGRNVLQSASLPNSRLSSIISHVIVPFFLYHHFHPLPNRISGLNREEYSARLRGGKARGVEYLGYSREFKSRAKSPGRLLLRANYRPTRLPPIYLRERALLGYGGRAIDGT